jgi:cell division initiation protein
MIDLTPLDVRKKRGDFRKAMRGYEPAEVDTFMDIVAERLEELVKEVMMLRERTALLQAQVDAQGGREKAVQDALVTAQSLRDQISDQSRREAEIARREAEIEARGIVAEAESHVEDRQKLLDEL